MKTNYVLLIMIISLLQSISLNAHRIESECRYEYDPFIIGIGERIIVIPRWKRTCIYNLHKHVESYDARDSRVLMTMLINLQIQIDIVTNRCYQTTPGEPEPCPPGVNTILRLQPELSKRLGGYKIRAANPIRLSSGAACLDCRGLYRRIFRDIQINPFYIEKSETDDSDHLKDKTYGLAQTIIHEVVHAVGYREEEHARAFAKSALQELYGEHNTRQRLLETSPVDWERIIDEHY